jgi:hypothetical protein
MNNSTNNQITLSMLEDLIVARKKSLNLLRILVWIQLGLSAFMISLGIQLIVKNPSIACLDFALGVYNGYSYIKGKRDIIDISASIAEVEAELAVIKRRNKCQKES